MPITPLPPAPDRNDPDFSTTAANFAAALPRFGDEANALEQSLQLVATTGTSGTTLSIGTGSKVLSTQVGKAWVAGAYVYIVDASDVANLLYGQITEYVALTGGLTVNVSDALGSGTHSSWVIGLSVPSTGSPVFTGPVTAQQFKLDDDAFISKIGADPTFMFDDGDYMFYNRAPNLWGVVIGGVGQFYVDEDGPQRSTDATTSDGLVRLSQLGNGTALGGVRGLVISASGVDANVSVSAEALMLVTSVAGLTKVVAPSLTINAAASGLNGLDTGVLAANTWYAVWVISNGASTAGLLSLSGTAPSLPGGYTFNARVGWIRTDASGNKYPLSFVQHGRKVQYRVATGSNVPALPQIASGTQGSTATPTWVAFSLSSFIPATACRVLGIVQQTASNQVMAGPNSSYGAFSSATNPPPLQLGEVGAKQFEFAVESMNIYGASNAASASWWITGWEDNL